MKYYLCYFGDGWHIYFMYWFIYCA